MTGALPAFNAGVATFLMFVPRGEHHHSAQPAAAGLRDVPDRIVLPLGAVFDAVKTRRPADVGDVVLVQSGEDDAEDGAVDGERRVIGHADHADAIAGADN